ADVVIETKVPALQPSDLLIEYAPDPGWDRATTRTFPDVLELARALQRVVGSARPLRPEDLLPPEESARADDADGRASDLEQRVTNARNDLASRLGSLRQSVSDVVSALEAGDEPKLKPLFDALRNASLLGLPGAFPGGRAADELLAQARSASSELERRD